MSKQPACLFSPCRPPSFSDPACPLPPVQVAAPAGSESIPLCGDNALGSSSCEYVLYGSWSLTELDFTCCSHGFSNDAAVVTPVEPFQCDDNANHSPYAVYVGSTTFNNQTGTTQVALSVEYQPGTCDAADPLNAGCCSSDLKAVYIALPTDVVSVLDVSTTPDVSPSFSTLPSGINVTAGFGAGSSWQLLVTVAGQLTAADICPSADGCTYRLYGGPTYSTPYSCCPTDYFWSV